MSNKDIRLITFEQFDDVIYKLWQTPYLYSVPEIREVFNRLPSVMNEKIKQKNNTNSTSQVIHEFEYVRKHNSGLNGKQIISTHKCWNNPLYTDVLWKRLTGRKMVFQYGEWEIYND